MIPLPTGTIKRRLALDLVVLACAIFFSQTIAPARATNILAPEKAAAVDEAVRAEIQKQGVVGAAIGIIQGSKITYLQAYGEADRERHIPATTETVFNWASNSKPLAAVAAMQLVESGALDLDADVRKYVPEFPDKGSVITMRHLLAHQSGIPHYSNGEVVRSDKRRSPGRPFMDAVAALDTFRESPLLFTPGEKTSYSSYAYILVSAVVQRAGKQPFLNQVQERIAKPLDMKSLQIDLEARNQRNWAAGYTKGDEDQVTLAKDVANYWKHGAGAFKSDIGDFARWAQGLINHQLVSPQIEQQMWRSQSLANGEKTSRGLGFIVDGKDELKISHNGKQTEVTTRMVIYPQSRRGVVILCNCGFGDVNAISTVVHKALK